MVHDKEGTLRAILECKQANDGGTARDKAARGESIMVGEDFSADRMADEFVNYLYDKYRGSRHVRRVASWLGLLILGLEKIKDKWSIPRSRQLFFEADGHRYKMKYNHTIRPRGGIEIVEIGEGRGAPEIGSVMAITSLDDAARFYAHPRLRQQR